MNFSTSFKQVKLKLMPELLKSLNIRKVFSLLETKIDDSYPDSLFYVSDKNKKSMNFTSRCKDNFGSV